MERCAIHPALPPNGTFTSAVHTNSSRERRRWRFPGATAAFLLAACIGAHAGPIPIANGDFSNTANNGSVGGGVIGGSGNSAIGTGPWSGTWFGALGLLAPPTLTIGSGQASVGGLLGVNVLGLVNNGGSFRQVTSTPWQPNKHYTLTAEVTTSGLLDLNLLQAGNAGIALASGSTRVASSVNANSVTLSLLSGSTWRVQLGYDTGASVSGDIGVHLFAEPNGLLTASLLSSLSFDNVTLSSRMLNPVPAALVAVDASPRSATVGNAIAPPLAIKVLDADGDPIPGVTVTFTVPSSGPSATVSPNPATTNADGIAEVTTTANTIAGSYQIIGNVSGVATPIVWDMTNQPGPTAGFGGISGNAQTAVVATPFAAPMGVQAVDAFGNPVPGVAVTYTAPDSGASAGFPDANTTTITTGPDGRADAAPVANTIAGSYQIIATADGASPQAFDMTNHAGPAAAVGPAGGSGQGAVVLNPFPQPLSAFVGDAYGNPVGGVSVTFVAPSSGASATGVGTVSTGSDGLARITPTANGVAGAYAISAHASGVATPTTFALTNLLRPTVVPGGPGEPSQNGEVNALFACVLLVQVTEDGTPQPDLAVDFVAPTSGPSSILSNGTDSGSAVRVTTDADGFAFVEATANGIAGDYVVGAQLLYSLAAPIEFRMRNLDAGDPVYANGFDGTCIPAVGTLDVHGDSR